METVKDNKIGKGIFAIMDKPKIVTEIEQDVAKRLDIKQLKVTRYISRFENEQFLACLTPKLKKDKPGRVYGLTDKGIRYKKQLCKKEGVKFIYRAPIHMNWYNYGWCSTGAQKKAIIRAMTEKPQTQREIRTALGGFYRTRNYRKGKSAAILIARGNLNDILQKMLQRRIVELITIERKRKNPINRYKLTDKGLKIKEIILS
jgi:DNA-binding PadR family transcriptional regulator